MTSIHGGGMQSTPEAALAEGSRGKKNKMPKVAFASFMGTVIEFYDFNIFATASALVFATAYFPALGAQAGTIVVFATLGVAFVARPLGSIIFGHFGDRLGRKQTLITTMTLMGVSTVLIGLLPTAATVGVVAPIVLVTLRIAQGVAAGGEWAGAALFTAENAPKASRGFWGMFTNLGGAVANILALSTFLLASLFMTDATFADWGWRVPFLLSLGLFAVGLYVRLKLEETPVFATEAKQGEPRKLPFKEAFTNQWQQILLAAGTLVASFAFGYIGVAYLTNYGTATLGLSRPEVLGAGVFGAVIQGLAIISGGILSDRIGRKRVLLIANSVAIPWALCLFPLLDTAALPAFWLGMFVTLLIGGHGFGVAGSFLSELFPTRYRYTAAGLAYSVAGIVGGALPPLVAATIITEFGSMVFGILLALLCAAALWCTMAVRETKDRELSDILVEPKRP
jgi:MFS family permease